jgi:hypothetical protein
MERTRPNHSHPIKREDAVAATAALIAYIAAAIVYVHSRLAIHIHVTSGGGGQLWWMQPVQFCMPMHLQDACVAEQFVSKDAHKMEPCQV